MHCSLPHHCCLVSLRIALVSKKHRAEYTAVPQNCLWMVLQDPTNPMAPGKLRALSRVTSSPHSNTPVGIIYLLLITRKGKLREIQKQGRTVRRPNLGPRIHQSQVGAGL